MVRLIVTDMDGTLLDDQKRLPPKFIPLLWKLDAMGVRFAAASGRQYANIVRYFGDFAPRLLVIAESGGVLYEGDRPALRFPMSEAIMAPAVTLLREDPTVRIVFAGVRHAYIEESDRDFLDEAAIYFDSVRMVADWREALADDDIVRISSYEPGRVTTGSVARLAPLSDRLTVVSATDHWSNIALPEANKGNAVSLLCEKLGITPDAVMAFGDYDNDLDMLKIAKYGYAMANAAESVKRACRYRALSNNAGGVAEAIKAHFGL